MRASGVRPGTSARRTAFASPWVTSIAASLGQRTVGWSLGVWDSARPGVDVDRRAHARGDARPGSILLLHDGDGYDPDGDRLQTAEAVPAILDGLSEARISLHDAPGLTGADRS